MSPRTLAACAAALTFACAGCRHASTRRDPLQRQAIPAVSPNLPERTAAVPRPTPPAEPATGGPMTMVAVPRPTPPAPPPPGGSSPAPAPAIVTPVAAQIPEPVQAAPVAAAPPAPSGDDAARALLADARPRWANIPDFTATLLKREVVGGKSMPEELAEYRFRQNPRSVALRTVSANGRGREVCWVDGRDGESFHVLTGEGDNRLVGAGYKTTLRMDSAQATGKSRYRIREAGFGRTLDGLDNALRAAASGRARIECRPADEPGFTAVDVTYAAGADSTLPRGGRRRVLFDARPDSPTLAMPLTVQAWDAAGAEVEFYQFTNVRVGVGLTDAEFDPKRMGR